MGAYKENRAEVGMQQLGSVQWAFLQWIWFLLLIPTTEAFHAACVASVLLHLSSAAVLEVCRIRKTPKHFYFTLN